jgi:hypothetical protein
MVSRTDRAENWRAAFMSVKTPSNGFWREPKYARIDWSGYMASDDPDFRPF